MENNNQSPVVGAVVAVIAIVAIVFLALYAFQLLGGNADVDTPVPDPVIDLEIDPGAGQGSDTIDQ